MCAGFPDGEARFESPLFVDDICIGTTFKLSNNLKVHDLAPQVNMTKSMHPYD